MEGGKGGRERRKERERKIKMRDGEERRGPDCRGRVWVHATHLLTIS